MKYETMVNLHKLSYQNWNFGSLYLFEEKSEYTIFDLISFIPGVIGTKADNGLEWLLAHRKKWVIAKKPSNVPEEKVEKK